MKSLLAIVFFTGLIFATPTPAPTVVFNTDVNHSNIGFDVPIMGGLSSVSGKFTDFTVNLDIDEKDMTKSSVDVVIKATSIDTGIEGRDRHLRNPDFFEVDKYPDITFKSKSVKKKGKTMTLTGDFTMHGVTKEISFPFTIAGRNVNPKDQTVRYGFDATLEVNRRDFGINYTNKADPTFIGDVVTVNLQILTKPTKIETK